MSRFILKGHEKLPGAGARSMLWRAVFCSLISGCVFAPAHAVTQEELLSRLEAAGYSQIRENGSGKIKTFRAVKNGKEVTVIMDSGGHIKELQ
jgi:predicted RNA binding protein YcfA (HicA-like mRNA interferase family)